MKTNYETVKKINIEAANIATNLELEDRIEQLSESKAFITLKDHKENFQNDPKCRLINPAKSNIGKISKQLIQEVNKEIREKLELKQWQSTDEVLKWFNKIENKKSKSFLQMDIVEFYPSITKELLEKAIDWAATITPISKSTKEIILHSRKSFLFSTSRENEEPTTWTKKDGLFDVTMGAPDGAEVCELVGLFLLKEVKEKFPQLDYGLYRDDGLAAHDRISSRNMERIRQGLHKLFNSHGLKITIEPPNIKVVNFLDVKLNLENGTYCPYRKPNDTTRYVNTKSNHPPNVIKEVPKSINKRLSKISSTEKEFDSAKVEYQNALDEAGYKFTLKYEKPDPNTEDNNRKKKAKRSILWYNPPYNMAVTTNVGKRFLSLIDKHFPKSSKLNKILNRNTVKISYSCTKNIKAIIQSHNAKICSPKPAPAPSKKCNCQKKDKCPLENNCSNQKDVIYHAKLEEGDKKEYVGCAQDFKKRYYGHMESFRNEASKNKTALSAYVWDQDLAPEPKIKWSILANAPSYKKGSRYCDLCLTEKLHILKNFQNPSYLNKRSELAQRCRHRAKYLLQNC